MDDKTVIVNQEALFEVLAAASEKHANLGYAIDQLYKMAGEKTDKGDHSDGGLPGLAYALCVACGRHANLGYAIDQLYKMAGEKTDKGGQNDV